MKKSKQILILTAGMLLAAPFASADNASPRCLNLEKLFPSNISTVRFQIVDIQGVEKGSLLDQVSTLQTLNGQVPSNVLFPSIKQNDCDSVSFGHFTDGKPWTQTIVRSNPTELVLKDNQTDTTTTFDVIGPQRIQMTVEYEVSTKDSCGPVALVPVDTISPTKSTFILSWGQAAQEPVRPSDHLWSEIETISKNMTKFVEARTCDSAQQSDDASKAVANTDGGTVIQSGVQSSSAK